MNRKEGGEDSTLCFSLTIVSFSGGCLRGGESLVGRLYERDPDGHALRFGSDVTEYWFKGWQELLADQCGLNA